MTTTTIKKDHVCASVPTIREEENNRVLLCERQDEEDDGGSEQLGLSGIRIWSTRSEEEKKGVLFPILLYEEGWTELCRLLSIWRNPGAWIASGVKCSRNPSSRVRELRCFGTAQDYDGNQRGVGCDSSSSSQTIRMTSNQARVANRSPASRYALSMRTMKMLPRARLVI